MDALRNAGEGSPRVITLGLWVGPRLVSEKAPRRQGAEEALEGLEAEEMLGAQKPRESGVDLARLNATPLALMHPCIGTHLSLTKALFLPMSAKRLSNSLTGDREEILRG
jgi:hypothetical protein